MIEPQAWCSYVAVPGADPDSQGRTYYRCEFCGHERWSEHPPNRLHRLCGMAPPPREQVEADIVTDSCCTRPMNEIKAFLDVCFGGCHYMKRHCTRWSSRKTDQIQLWVEHVYDGDCDQFPK